MDWGPIVLLAMIVLAMNVGRLAVIGVRLMLSRGVDREIWLG
jgi:hypothetical protein